MNMVVMILFSLLWNLLIIGLIVIVVKKLFFSKKTDPAADKRSGFAVSFGREDGMSQLFFLFSVCLFGVLLLSANAKINKFFEGRDILFVTALAGICAGYYFRVIYTLVSGVIAMTVWWSLQAVHWADKPDIKPAAVFAGLFLIALMLYALGRIYETMGLKYKRLAVVYSIPGMLAIIAVFFSFSTRFGLRGFSGITAGASVLNCPPVLISVGVFLAVVMGLLSYGFKKRAFLPLEGVYLIFLALGFAALAFLPEQSVFLNKIEPHLPFSSNAYKNAEFTFSGLSWAVFFNVVIFLKLVGIIFLGYFKKEDKIINLGAFMVALLIFVKYFDWFFDFMDKSLFFLGAGVLLFALGWFMERGRKYMLAAIKKEGGN